MSSKSRKQVIKAAKQNIKDKHDAEDFEWQKRMEEAETVTEFEQLKKEWELVVESRNFDADRRKTERVIIDSEAYNRHKRVNRGVRRKTSIQWAEGGRELAYQNRRKKASHNVESPVGVVGALATVSRDISRWELAYGSEVGIKKGAVVMPVSDTYLHRDKKCITVLLDGRQFKGVPVACLRPIE